MKTPNNTLTSLKPPATPIPMNIQPTDINEGQLDIPMPKTPIPSLQKLAPQQAMLSQENLFLTLLPSKRRRLKLYLKHLN